MIRFLLGDYFFDLDVAGRRADFFRPQCVFALVRGVVFPVRRLLVPRLVGITGSFR